VVREKILYNIRKALDGHKYFDSTDFNIQMESSSVKIFYYDPKYYYSLKIPQESIEHSYGQYKFIATISPGPVSLNEIIRFSTEDSIYEFIDRWLNYLWEEIQVNPVIKNFKKQGDDINRIFEKLNDLPDEYFSPEEAESLTKRLDTLEKQFKEKLEEVLHDKKELKSEVEKLKNDISALKASLMILKKPSWRRNFVSKAYKWMQNSENRGLLKDGYNMIKNVLPENLPENLLD